MKKHQVLLNIVLLSQRFYSNKAKKIMLNLDKAKVKQAENYITVQDNTRVVRPVTPTRKITRER